MTSTDPRDRGVPLTGGNMGGAVRIGDTVRRQAGPWTPTVAALLEHVVGKGIDWAPRPLGEDSLGREVLTFLPGFVPAYPYPAWIWNDEVLVDAVEHLSELHEATAGFHRPGAVWRQPVREPAEVICHNDFAPYNFTFDDDQRISGVIDWDMAAPGPRVWDLAHLAYRLVPFHAPSNAEVPSTSGVERHRRLTLLCATYGPGTTPDDVVDAALRRVEALKMFTAERAAAGASHLADHLRIYDDDLAWLRSSRALLTG